MAAFLSLVLILICDFKIRVHCLPSTETRLEPDLTSSNILSITSNKYDDNDKDDELMFDPKLQTFGLLGLKQDLQNIAHLMKPPQFASGSESQKEKQRGRRSPQEANNQDGGKATSENNNKNDTDSSSGGQSVDVVAEPVKNNTLSGREDPESHPTQNLDLGQKKRNKEKFNLIDFLLPEDYTKYEIPTLVIPLPNGTILAMAIPSKVMINLRSILEIDETNERLMCDMDYIMAWVDGRILKPSFVQFIEHPQLTSMPSSFVNKIWKPDIYLDDLIELKKLSFMESPLAIAFDKNTGVIIYKQRLVPIIKCGMEFQYYPADTQVCQFSFRSYSYDIDHLKVTWGIPIGVFLRDTGDANFDVRIGELEHEIVDEEMDYGLSINKQYHTIKFKLFAKRKLSYHLIQTYIPSVFFVIITWLCFLLPPDMVEARIGIAMTTLLTMTAMFAAVRDSTPVVSYAKAIDIWMLVCIFFIFMTLFEFSFMVWINYLRGKNATRAAEEHEIRRRKSQLSEGSVTAAAAAEMQTGGGGVENELHYKPKEFVLSVSSLAFKRYELAANIIEKYAIVFYSMAFIIFTIGYWAWLLVSSGYFDWEVDPKFNNVDK